MLTASRTCVPAAARAGTLSNGEEQAVAIGRAPMTSLTLLLDEVSVGLSPLAVDRVLLMLEGRIVLRGRVADLSRDAITEAYFGLRAAA